MNALKELPRDIVSYLFSGKFIFPENPIYDSINDQYYLFTSVFAERLNLKFKISSNYIFLDMSDIIETESTFHKIIQNIVSQISLRLIKKGYEVREEIYYPYSTEEFLKLIEECLYSNDISFLRNQFIEDPESILETMIDRNIIVQIDNSLVRFSNAIDYFL